MSGKPVFTIQPNGVGGFNVLLNTTAAQMLANTISDKANKGEVAPAVYALGEQLSRLTEPAKWFGPGDFPKKNSSAA